jgi:hypothetical protein
MEARLDIRTPYDALDQMKFVSMGVLGLEMLGKGNYKSPELERFLDGIGEIQKYKVPKCCPIKARVLNESLDRIRESAGRDDYTAIEECKKLANNMDKIYLHLVMGNSGTEFQTCQS